MQSLSGILLSLMEYCLVFTSSAVKIRRDVAEYCRINLLPGRDAGKENVRSQADHPLCLRPRDIRAIR